MLQEELKKIWRPQLLIILLVLGFVFYTMFLKFHITYFPNGPYADGELRIAAQWLERYGTTLEPAELEEAVAGLTQLEAEANGYLADNPLAIQYGLLTYAQFNAFYEENVFNVSGELTDAQQERHSAAMRLLNYLQDDATSNIAGRLYATELYGQRYGYWQQQAEHTAQSSDETLTPKEYHHADTVFFGSDNAWRNILPAQLPQTTTDYLGYLLIWMTLSLCLLLSPLLVRDHLYRVSSLQWSSRHGRRILRTQFIATMLSALLLTTINLLIFGGLFLTNDISSFYPCRMFSFMDTTFSWPNWTFGVWCLVLVALCYLIGLGIAAIVFFLSQYSSHYVAMLLKLIPLFVLTALLCPNLLKQAFYYTNPLYRLTHLPGIEAITAGFILLLGFALCFWALRRQRQQELLN